MASHLAKFSQAQQTRNPSHIYKCETLLAASVAYMRRAGSGRQQITLKDCLIHIGDSAATLGSSSFLCARQKLPMRFSCIRCRRACCHFIMKTPFTAAEHVNAIPQESAIIYVVVARKTALRKQTTDWMVTSSLLDPTTHFVASFFFILEPFWRWPVVSSGNLHFDALRPFFFSRALVSLLSGAPLSVARGRKNEKHYARNGIGAVHRCRRLRYFGQPWPISISNKGCCRHRERESGGKMTK